MYTFWVIEGVCVSELVCDLPCCLSGMVEGGGGCASSDVRGELGVTDSLS